MTNFNKEQQEAIDTLNGTVQVIAAAGSGKSTTLVARIENLVANGINQDKILTISFTNASATDLKTKLAVKGLNEVSVGTFHSICKEILESQGVTNLFNSPNRYSVKRMIEQTTKEKNINIEDILSWIGYQKNHLLDSKSPEFKSKESLYDVIFLRKCFNIYETYCKNNEACDFEDWLINTYKLYNSNYSNGKKLRYWDYILVDELQDSNIIQYKLLDYFCPTKNIFVVGDLQQTLYEFRGSAPELFKTFPDTYKDTKVINMNTNYRSCKNIIDAANNFIRPYVKGYKYYKDAIASNDEDGEIITNYYNDRQEEANAVVKNIERLIESGEKLDEIAIIYRNHSHVDAIENLLKSKKITYSISSNNSFFDKKEIKGILAILRLILNSTDDESFEILFRETRFHPTNYYTGNLTDKLIVESGKKDCSLYEAFLEHRWDKPYERNNAKTLEEYINRLKIQREKKLSISKIIDNIVRMFKIKEYINEKYAYSSIQDKLDSIENLKKISETYRDLGTFLEYCLTGGVIKKKNKENSIKLCTIHSSKGLEFNNVFVIGLENEVFPSDRANEESEARLFYVGITRAKKFLWVSSINYSQFYAQYKEGLNK